MTTLAPSFLNGSSSNLQVKRTTIKACMSFIFGQIPSLTTELAALEHLKNRCTVVTSLAPSFFDWILFILAGNVDSHKISDDSKYGQIGPWTAKLAALERLENSHRLIIGKIAVATLAPSFLIGSSLFLHVTRTTMKVWASSNFSQILYRTAELAALERLEKII